MNKEQIILTAVLDGAAIIYLLWMVIMHSPGLQAEDEQYGDGATGSTGGTATPLLPPGTDTCIAIPVGAPPSTYKIHRLLITKCSDPMMWYAKLVGQEVPYLGTWPSDGCHKSREPAGFVNIVKMTDARIIIKEEKAK